MCFKERLLKKEPSALVQPRVLNWCVEELSFVGWTRGRNKDAVAGRDVGHIQLCNKVFHGFLS
jgi:hypothetical protein